MFKHSPIPVKRRHIPEEIHLQNNVSPNFDLLLDAMSVYLAVFTSTTVTKRREPKAYPPIRRRGTAKAEEFQ